MNITIATGPLLPVPALRGGAIPRLWQGLAEEFARRGNVVGIVARAFPGQPRAETINGVRYFRHGGFSQGRQLALDLTKDFFYAASVVGRLPAADILVTNDFWLPVFAGWLRPRSGKIVVNANRFPKGQFRLYGRAALIAAASGAVREAIVRQCPKLAKRTRVVANPVDTALLFPKAADRAENVAKMLLFVGRLHPEKGVHVLIRAFRQISARHPGWTLRIVGPLAEGQGGGGEGYRRQLDELASGLPVEFSGAIFEMQALANIYCAADLFCYPSLAEAGEAFGVAPLEAMACGVPPVVSGLECFRDFIRDGETGWVFDHRGASPAAALAGVLDLAMRDGARREAAARRASETARRFSYTAIAGQYLDEFQRVLAGKN